jgi:hypothetical protein
MMLHEIAKKVRPLVPLPVFDVTRRILTAALTPIMWSQQTGHWKSSLNGRPLGPDGKPVIWYTYPAIFFLQQPDFSDKRILEIGAGHSTLWWASRSMEVLSLEGDPEWFGYLSPRVPDNVAMHLVEIYLNEKTISLCQSSGPFDVIAIDGLDRQGFAYRSAEWLVKDGIVILDNSEGYWGGDSDGSHPIIEQFQAAGFRRVDFYGHSPATSLPSCTSIFFRNDSFVFRDLSAPVKL